MWIAVIPAMNEEKSITQVLKNVVGCHADRIVLVANGCQDATCRLATQAAGSSILNILFFPQPLGLDIPRAIGAAWSKRFRPTGILFVDGDMKGDLVLTLRQLITGIEQGLDMALTNCYPQIHQRSELAATVLQEREKLNRKMGPYQQIGLATPSHGPHAVSGRLLEKIPLETLAVPPLSLAWSYVHNYRIGIAATITHHLLGSDRRNDNHAAWIAQTIIADCHKAVAYLEGMPLPECVASRQYSTYCRQPRRFDVLAQFLSHLE